MGGAEIVGRAAADGPGTADQENGSYQHDDAFPVRATTLISKSNPASQVTPTAVQFG